MAGKHLCTFRNFGRVIITARACGRGEPSGEERGHWRDVGGFHQALLVELPVQGLAVRLHPEKLPLECRPVVGCHLSRRGPGTTTLRFGVPISARGVWAPARAHTTRCDCVCARAWCVRVRARARARMCGRTLRKAQEVVQMMSKPLHQVGFHGFVELEQVPHLPDQVGRDQWKGPRGPGCGRRLGEAFEDPERRPAEIRPEG